MNKLPQRPNISHLKSQAKDLIKRFRAGDAWAFDQFKAYHPTFRGKALLNISLSEMRLSDAQLVIARSYGFSRWELLSRHVAAVRGEGMEKTGTGDGIRCWVLGIRKMRRPMEGEGNCGRAGAPSPAEAAIHGNESPF